MADLKFVADRVTQARSLRYIDLSDTNWDKRSVDYLVQALVPIPSRSVSPAAAPTTRFKGSSPESNQAERISDQEKSGPHASADAGPNSPEDESQEDEKLHNAYGSFIPPAPLLREGEEEGGPASVHTLRMDGCGIRATALESLGESLETMEMVHSMSLFVREMGTLAHDLLQPPEYVSPK